MTRTLLLFLAVCLGCLLLLEPALRHVAGRAPDGSPLASVALRFYPELARVLTDPPRRDDGRVDILLLGGSVLARLPDPTAELEQLLGRPVRVDNVGEGGHTSRDSRIKYDLLGAPPWNARYDAVVFYHAINEVRANNCPPELYRSDYGHYAWYSQVNVLLQPWSRNYWAPTLLQTGWHGLLSRLNRKNYVPTHVPKDRWLEHGRELKTPPDFAANLAAILDLAQERGDGVLLGTFALYLPPDYSREAFEAKGLDYAKHDLPAEIWGLPEVVRQGVAAHNAELRRLAEARGLPLVDVDGLLPKGGRYFDDPCHLTPEGYAAFKALLFPPLLHLIGEERP